MMSGGDIGSVNDEMVCRATEPEVKSTHYVNTASMSTLTAHTFMVAACISLAKQVANQATMTNR
jgi:hypothetical protein